MWRRRDRCLLRLVVGVVSVSTVLSACTGPPASSSSAARVSSTGQRASLASALNGTLVTPPIDRPAEPLRDTSGRWFSVAHRPRREVTVLFFGFTNCPAVCPTTLADLAAARARLPMAVRDHVQVVFVTEDPRRDTPAVLRRWLDRFDPSFVGLMGHNAKTRDMLDELHMPQTRYAPSPRTRTRQGREHGHQHEHQRTHDDYTVGHSGIVYAFGPNDDTVIYTGGTTATQYAQDFTRLVNPAAAPSS